MEPPFVWTGRNLGGSCGRGLAATPGTRRAKNGMAGRSERNSLGLFEPRSPVARLEPEHGERAILIFRSLPTACNDLNYPVGGR